MKGWLARWDVTPAEQAGMSFGQVLTTVNVRRVEIVCLLGLMTRAIEQVAGLQGPAILFEVPLMLSVLLVSLAVRRSRNPLLARGFVGVVLFLALLETQWTVAALGASGRLTSAYPLMLLSLAMLFVLQPRLVALTVMALFASYSLIVLDTPTRPEERVVAIVNTAIVSVISVVAAMLIYSARSRDHMQKREIQLQNELLVDRNLELDTLMAITAHDLRSPLYGLRNLFDLAVRRAPQEPELPLTIMRQAMPSLDAMLALATRLLEAHSAEHRPLTRPVKDDVRGQILAAIERIEPLAQSADVRVETDLADRPLIATLDGGALAQVLDNLLSNGVKFSPAGGALTISAAREGSQITIKVRDRGPGVDPDRQGLLFKKFHRGAGGRSDGVPGTGMGLFIVATLAERMGAAVRCEPAAGRGSVFVVTLPPGE